MLCSRVSIFWLRGMLVATDNVEQLLEIVLTHSFAELLFNRRDSYKPAKPGYDRGSHKLVRNPYQRAMLHVPLSGRKPQGG